MFRNSVIRLFWWPLFFLDDVFLDEIFVLCFFFFCFRLIKKKKRTSADEAVGTVGARPKVRNESFCLIRWHPGFTEFYRVLPIFTEFYRVLPSFTELLSRAATRKSDGTNRRWRLSTGWISFFLQGFTGFYLVLIFFKKKQNKKFIQFRWLASSSKYFRFDIVTCFFLFSGD